MKKIIVTGSTSMIGQALIEAALEAGCTVCAVVRENCTRLDRLPEHENLQRVVCNLEEMDRLPEKIDGSWDVFYHIAWGNTGTARNKSVVLQSNNIDYTLKTVKAAKELGCRKFIGAGSQAEYGPLNLDRIGPDTPEHPTTPYGAAKLASAQLSKMYCEELGMAWNWPRIFSVYGFYEKDCMMVKSAFRDFGNGESGAFTPAEQMWDYLYAKDAGRAFYLIGEKGKNGAIYCIGSGQCRPLREYILAIRDLVAPGLEPGIGKMSYQPNPVMRLCADITSLCEDTGFRPQVSFEEGIREMYEMEKRK